MGRWRSTALPGRTDGGRVLDDIDLEQALRVCAQDPVAAVLATTRLEAAVRLGLRLCGGQLWGYHRDGELVAVCWAGANLVPVVPDGGEDALDAFAELALRAGRQCSSIVGDAEAVLGLWERLSGSWSRPRDVRADQPSMVIDHEPLVVPDPFVRRSRREEYDLVLPACVRMFVEEVGYSPTSGQGAGPYESRVRSLIAEGRSFVRIDDVPPGREGPAREVVFKAELGAIAGGVAQVQGVWVVPHLRGLGLSEQGMAAVVQATLRHVAPTVSLYANSYNVRALAAYRAVGFRQVGTYATILF